MQNAKLGKFTVFFNNSEEYHRIKREVWGANDYYVELEKEAPTILDIGAHIGITTLYFKRLFPKALIIAIEPIEESAQLLEKNIFENQVEGIEVYKLALSDHVGEEILHKDKGGNWYSTASINPGAWNGDQTSEMVRVPCEKLSLFLEKYQPDLVKMDIEGAEEKVLFSSRESISICPEYMIEFHPIEGRGMEKIIRLFTDLGYKAETEQNGKQVEWQRARGLTLIRAKR